MASELPGLLRSVDCIRLRVPDLDSGLSFYRNKLGHELLWRTAAAAGLRMPDADTEIVIYTEGPSEAIDVKVRSAGEAAEAFVHAGGAVAIAPFDIAIGRCVVVRDPWSNALVLLDDSKGHLITDADGHVTGTG